MSTESRAERRPGLPAHLAAAPARHPGVAVDGHQRVVERRPVLGDADDARRRPLARAPRGARRGDTVTNCHLRAEQVVDWATRGGARALGLDDDLGSLEAGQEGRRRADQERPLAGVVPAAQPLRPRRLPGAARRRAHRDRRRPGREARAPAGRRRPRRRCGARSRRPSSTCRSTLGEEAWAAGHEPRAARETKVLDNPYQYTEFRTGATHGH